MKRNYKNSFSSLDGNSLPDFTSYGYQVTQKLGHNYVGGRTTYLATSTMTQQCVVIKQFQFFQHSANWTDYENHEQEIVLLRQLNHSCIPKYLDVFEISTGFCLVQEYKQAIPLNQVSSWTLQEIKQIAVFVLEILVYLQQQSPIIIHRDLKPENILVDRQLKNLKVYMIDFGFAHTGVGDVAASSAVKGTLGFMPPEQLFNRQLTEASDLYSLGATLVCLLTGIKSTEISSLMDETYRINFQSLVPKLNQQFISWLEKMTSPSLKHRYSSAAVALEALQSVTDINREKTISSKIIYSLKNKPGRIVVLSIFSSAALCYGAWISLEKLAFMTRGLNIYNVWRLEETNDCPVCELSSMNIDSKNLAYANLASANLEDSSLNKTDLRGAILISANLKRAQLKNVNLQDAKLISANLKDANLTFANLENADLRGANLEGANLEGARLKGAKMPDQSIPIYP